MVGTVKKESSIAPSRVSTEAQTSSLVALDKMIQMQRRTSHEPQRGARSELAAQRVIYGRS